MKTLRRVKMSQELTGKDFPKVKAKFGGEIGYNIAIVDKFLKDASIQVEEMERHLEDLEEENHLLREEVKQSKEEPEVSFDPQEMADVKAIREDALATKRAYENMIYMAEKHRQMIIQEAEKEAEQIVFSAEQKAEQIMKQIEIKLEEAQKEAERWVDIQEEIKLKIKNIIEFASEVVQ